MLLHQATDQVAALRKEAKLAAADDERGIFDSADDALSAAHKVGFEVAQLGVWRPNP